MVKKKEEEEEKKKGLSLIFGLRPPKSWDHPPPPLLPGESVQKLLNYWLEKRQIASWIECTEIVVLLVRKEKDLPTITWP